MIPFKKQTARYFRAVCHWVKERYEAGNTVIFCSISFFVSFCLYFKESCSCTGVGIYHPHAQYHHIKKENIGLIEVMGLAVLPARLKEELELLEEYILSGKDISSNEKIAKHEDWVKELLEKYPDINAENIHAILQKEVGLVFVHVLEDAGVYKCTPKGREAFMRFVDSL